MVEERVRVDRALSLQSTTAHLLIPAVLTQDENSHSVFHTQMEA